MADDIARDGRPRMDQHRIKLVRLVLAADLAGTFVFGLQGALSGLPAHLDLLGILVLAFATALGGGIVRDVLIGAVPPNAIRDWRYPVVALAAGAAVLLGGGWATRLPGEAILVLDAAGLALFAVAGTEKALEFGITPLVAAMLGTVGAVGGGTLRDVLLVRIPVVLRVDVYATAALAGGLALVLGRRAGLPPVACALGGGLLCFALRLVAAWRHWNLPVPG